jgi:zinc transporter 1/2/3
MALSLMQVKWLAFGTTLLGGLLGLFGLIFRNPRKDHIVIIAAFAAGIFLSVGLVHMLAEANEQLDIIGPYPWAFVIAGTAALFLHFVHTTVTSVLLQKPLEDGYPTHSSIGDSGECPTVISNATIEFDDLRPANRKRKLGKKRRRLHMGVMTFTIALHSAFAGLALGVEDQVSDVVATLVAILVHKAVAAFVLCTIYLKAGLSMRATTALIVAFSCVTPFGIGLGIAISQNSSSGYSLASGVIVALSAGTFLYIAHSIMFDAHSGWGSLDDTDSSSVAGAEEFPGNGDASPVPRATTTLTRVATNLVSIAGFAIMAVVAIWS